MAFEKIYTFSNDGKTWDIYADFSTQAVQTVNTPNPQIVGPGVDAIILGFNEGDVMISRCAGTTLLQVTALFAYPYAQFASPVLNSPTCGYTPPTCDVRYSASTTTATNGLNTGTATVTMLSSGTYLFSLDNISWQGSNVFNNLFPGNYIIYVLQTGLIGTRHRCRANSQFTVADQTVVLPVNTDPIPYADSKNLCLKFRMVHDGTTYDVREPVGWDAVELTGERDLEYHGYQFKYTGPDVVLKFPCDSGGDLIRSVYENAGTDGDVNFEYYYAYFGVETILLSAKVLLTDYKRFPSYVQCTIHGDQFDAKLLSRMEVPVSMAATKTYDGSDVVPPSPYNLTLHAKEILSRFVEVTTNPKNAGLNTPLHSTTFSILPGIDDPSINDLLDSGTFALYSTLGTPVEDGLFIHKFATAGKIDLSLNWPLNFTVNINNNDLFSGGTFDCKMVYIFRKYDPLSQTYAETQETISAVISTAVPVFSANNYDISLIGTKTLSGFDVNVGDEIYWFTFVETNREFTGVSFPFVTQPTISYTVSQSQKTADSSANVWLLDDAIRQIISVISDNKFVFRSTFFERASATQINDGQASKRVLTNGFQIRKFDVTEKPLKVDFKTVLSSINAQNCIGCIYRVDQFGRSVVQIERREFFYQDNEILSISETQSYDEQAATDYLYFNELDFGNKIFKTDGFNSLDEFNTEQKDLTPIQNNPKKLTQVSDIIISGFSIEDIRRQQFAATPTDSYNNDDNPVMVCVKRSGVQDWVTEKNESFSTVENLFSPETSYNLRLSPRRAIYNWFVWLKGCFFYKDGAAQITNTAVTQNGDMITQFNGAEVDVIGDINKDLIQEKENFPVSKMNDTYSIYRPEWVNVVCRLSPSEVQLINEAMIGLSDSTKNYGYIMVKNDQGNWQAGWIFSLKYNYAFERATIKMLKKAVSPEAPTTNCCKWLVVNGCYLLVNGQRLIA